jgi:uncharacterized SAM-binding protein YcdF (DUF218 family)
LDKVKLSQFREGELTMTELLKELLLPSHISAILFFFGLCFSAIGKFRRKGQYLLAAGAAVYLVFSNGLIAASVIGPLEYRYPPLLRPGAHPQVDTAVVLTSYAANDLEMPLSSRPGASAAYRVLEASRLYAGGHVTTVVVSGDATAAGIMADLLKVSGVPNTAIVVDSGAAHTVDSARRLKSILTTSEVFLVTSAGHMPRALGVFRAQGVDAIPAPTDFQLPRDPSMASMKPTPFHLRVSDLAVHEYAGLLWYWLSGKTDRFW